MMKRYHLLVIVLLMFVLSACQGATPQVNTQNTAASTSEPVPTPAAGKATVTGRLLSADGNVPFDNLVVRLARVYKTGDQAAFALDMGSSPGDFTDPNGVFIIPDVEVSEYVVIIGDPESEPYVVSDDENNATVYTAEAGKTLDLGDLKIDYQP